MQTPAARWYPENRLYIFPPGTYGLSGFLALFGCGGLLGADVAEVFEVRAGSTACWSFEVGLGSRALLEASLVFIVVFALSVLVGIKTSLACPVAFRSADPLITASPS